MDRRELKQWNKNRKYYKGFSKDRDVYLYYKENGERHVEVIKNYPFFFFIREEDFFCDKNRRFIKKCYENRFVLKFKKCNEDNGIKKWIRVYVNKVYKREYSFNTYLESGEWNKLENLERVVEVFEKYGIKTYEADVTPLHRFLSDYDVNVETDLNLFFFDLETDDTKGGFEDNDLMRNRILSFSYYDQTGKNGFYCSERNDDRSERRLLDIFYNVAKKYDVLLAWNGINFDFKVVRFRMKYHNIDKWNKFEHSVLHSDLMLCMKRNTPSGEIKSFSLNNVGDKVLKMKKIDVTSHKKIINLYNNDRKLFEKYNRRDSELLYLLEKSKGYFKNDVRTAKLGNRFSNYFRPSQKVEGALLKEANIRGYHYETHKGGVEVKYPGGYVMKPEPGVYKNVAVFDYKSLYVTLFETFNISHDTFIDLEKEEVNLEPDELIYHPAYKKLGCLYRRDFIGVIPGLIQELNKKRDRFEELRAKEEHGSEKYYEYFWASSSHKSMILSFYGELGNWRGRFFNVKMASSITLAGQFFNKFANLLAKSKGFSVKYGDTDSLFIKLKMYLAKKFLEYVHRMFDQRAKKFNAIPGRIKLQFEDYYKKIVFCEAKKRYFGSLIMEKGKRIDEKLKARGFEIRRTDVPEIAKKFQEMMMKLIVIENCSEKRAIAEVKIIKRRILNHAVDKDELLCYQAIGKKLNEYNNPVIDSKTGQPKIKKNGEIYTRTAPIHIKIAKRMKASGKEVYVGMQVPYIVTNSIPSIQGIHESEYTGKYDEKYYFNDKVFEPVKRILKVVFPNVNWDSFYVDGKKKGKFKNKKQMVLLNEL